MRNSTWLVVIGIAVLFLVIGLFAGLFTIPVTTVNPATSASVAQAMRAFTALPKVI